MDCILSLFLSSAHPGRLHSVSFPLGIMNKRYKFRINGIVQGVGFRPFIYKLASSLQLTGSVLNSSNGVVVEVEGPDDRIERFANRLVTEAPVLSRIIDCRKEEVPPTNDRSFIILRSEQGDSPDTLISPDVAVCEKCLGEMLDPQDRRYLYPFINCTDCGPRFSIINSVPYDRKNTSMRVFPLCPTCKKEYEDPTNRRFHAQPNACPDCGPSVQLVKNRQRQDLPPGEIPLSFSGPEAIAKTRELLLGGNIIAVKGIGGFHLAVDATNSHAVRTLRERKGREEKPFAIMASSLEWAQKICRISESERAALTSWQKPIILLKKNGEDGLAPEVAPENSDYGIMLPYAPLHYLLLREPLRYLVMTSGNYSEEPIAIGDQEALNRLTNIADWTLLHNREILQRCDDSIVRVIDEHRLSILRRSRGFVPYPVFIGGRSSERILACGPELKNTIAFLRNDQVFISQHIGDLDNPESFNFYKHCIDHLGKILQIEPSFLAYDLHPEYLSSKWALEQDLPALGIQHHHAHLASVLADNHIDEPAIGIILDGTGFGPDGTIWGGEILEGDASGYNRVCWLKNFRLPGGTMAIKQPWRIALSLLDQELGEDLFNQDLKFLSPVSRNDMKNLLRISRAGINSPWTSSCGRLFDAISALLNIKPTVAFEAQAAIALQMEADEEEEGIYHEALDIEGTGPISIKPLLETILKEIRNNIPRRKIAGRFHNTLAEMFTRAAVVARKSNGINLVGLSGGVYQNTLFSRRIETALQREGFKVITHGQVPPNDGGISLGQIVIAEKMLSSSKRGKIKKVRPVG